MSNKITYNRIIRIFALLLLIIGALHYLYVTELGLNFSFFFIIFSPLMLLISLLPSKKSKNLNNSKVFGIIGVLFAIISYAIYFSYIYGLASNQTFPLIFSIIGSIYFLFLFYYNGYLNF